MRKAQLGAGRGLHPPDDEPHRRGVGLTGKGGIDGLGHVGGSLHPVRDGRPILFRYGLDQVAQYGVLADGDGVADLLVMTGGHDTVGVETAVRPYGQWSGGSGVAHSAHRLAQEIGSAPSRVGASLAQPCHQYVARAGGDGQQRVIAPLVRLWRIVVPTRTLLAQPVGLTDRGVQVDGQRIIAWSNSS